TLQRGTRRYTFENKIEVIDLGLRLADVKKWKLQAESVHYGKGDPRPNLRENEATQKEIDFLVSGGHSWSGHTGQRVELNAFNSKDLVDWIESKLQKHGIKKVVPDEATLEHAYRRAAQIALINERVQEITEQAQQDAAAMKIPKWLEAKIRE